MRITEVSAVVRYSAETKGAWRSIEPGFPIWFKMVMR
jgi:hypothetical protein